MLARHLRSGISVSTLEIDHGQTRMALDRQRAGYRSSVLTKVWIASFGFPPLMCFIRESMVRAAPERQLAVRTLHSNVDVDACRCVGSRLSGSNRDIML